MQLIGDFYRHNILTRDDLVHRELNLSSDGDPEIVEHLFGWELRANESVIDCRSEAEARYLRVFLELGLHEVAVPASDEYLSQILSDLEYLKRRADEILNEHLETVFDPRIKARVRRQVYGEITKSH
jgi:isopentenyldiphosphate isomerase